MGISEIAVLDYGLGNLRSVVRGLEAAGARPTITSDPEVIRSADGIVLPGVGAFAEGMDKLSPLRGLVNEEVEHKPLLGICLGMQMLLEESEEYGIHQGLGFVPGTVRLFPKKPGMKVPQMGWNTITPSGHPLFEGIPDGTYVYFVHSYYADTTQEATLSTTEYSVRYASAVGVKNALGVQFHPEKSGTAGIAILRNFVGLTE
ncbi:MAG: imidazole glycerol phosphate synthase subunit HisH [Methanocorpusculum sp.]|jgi:glutamine amidotransferase|nr:imidazole glycerol phosphate synthase subunit HisH [Methanocorpusculum sp.]MDD2470899.1 imidazole glycerol phosphate synthase subunit HisH [Methanocorpusculum sp.]MDD3256921.1 imidazole glycerol phosphate synthase subunit HisH [Methanocorpusculum sp.]MDD4132763.1 imidazole glycerol phosphate synthase subunit HisH [Methanocorpusculum sp.]